ncbi:hypothetical protein BC332_29653 [Capsicum chinense]|nr:hypothetical protein BC332_29653 [Capsicum chinense]
MKFEFIALDKAGEEAEWLQNFLKDISYWPKTVAPVCIHCDSQAAIGRAGSMMYNGKSHHIRQRHNTIRELLSSEIITVDYVKSKDNMPDPLTKGLSREGVERTSKGMGLRPRTSQHGASTISDTAGSNRKRKAEAIGNVSKRKKNKESVSKSNLDLKEISDYVDSSEDVIKHSASGNSEESKDSGRNSADGDNDPLSVPSFSRFIFVERYDLRTIMDEVGSFPAKISVKSRMAAYRDSQQVLVDQELKKRFKWSYFGHLRNLPEHLKFNGQLVNYLML